MARQAARWRLRSAVLLLPALLGLGPAVARGRPAYVAPGHVVLKTGDHDHFGRVVFLVPRGVTARLDRQGDTARVVLAGAGAVPGTVHGSRNVAAIDGGNDGAVLVLTPGANPVLWQDGAMVVVDVFSATQPAPDLPATAKNLAAMQPFRARGGVPAAGAPAVVVTSALPRSQAPGPVHATVGGEHAIAATAGGAEPVTSSDATGRAAPADAVATDGLVAVRAPPGPGEDAAIMVPFDVGVGAAAFPHGGAAHVIFDESKPVDLAALKDDPVFGGAHVTLLPAATHLTLKLHPGQALRLRRQPEGWVVAVVTAARADSSAAVRMSNGVVGIDTPEAAETVVSDDPATGGRLLAGTVRHEGPGVAVGHRSPEFTLLPSWTGVLVAAGSDRLALRSGKAGFTLAAATGPKLVAAIDGDAAQAVADAGDMTRRWDLGPVPEAVRVVQMRRVLSEAAVAPKLARFRPRLRAAQHMLALGMDREVGALLRVAVRDDPSQAGNADAAALLGMAAWLGGGGDGGAAALAAEPLAAAALGGSDEVALWRAVLRPEPVQTAAAALAGNWRLLLAYSEPLRRRLLPVVADILVRGGQPKAAAALLAAVPGPALDAARALALHQAGKTDAALALLDRLAAGRDRRAAARALRDAVEWRLAAGRITPGEAADTLDKHLDDWRDDTADAGALQHIAALRAKAGAWRVALQVLRGVETDYPDAREAARAAERTVIGDLLHSGGAGKIAPLDLVALVEENAELLAGQQASATIAPVLADKLMALDLPDRAAPIIARLMAATSAEEPKAGLGARLATLRLDQGDAAGARAALTASDAPGLPAGLAAHRIALLARALLLEGNDDAALRLLGAQTDAEGLELRARLLEKRRAWPAATASLKALVAASLPATGKLADAQQDLVLRLASAASQAGDMALLQQLQAGDANRLAPGPRADLFRALATRPVQSLADLPRSAVEARQAGMVPAALASYTTH
jgi:hypothetical protein